jgi:hypothetical protein
VPVPLTLRIKTLKARLPSVQFVLQRATPVPCTIMLHPSQTVPSATRADLDAAARTSENKLDYILIAHLAVVGASTTCSNPASIVLTFMIFAKLICCLLNSSVTRNDSPTVVGFGFPIDNLLCSFFESLFIPMFTVASFPLRITNVAEFMMTMASTSLAQVSRGEGKVSTHVI